MELVLLELMLWVGLLFFFWALREGLGRVETDIESLGLTSKGDLSIPPIGTITFQRPDSAAEPIGTYQDTPIFRYVRIDGRCYQFDRVCPPEIRAQLDSAERYVAPGLVYQECEVPVGTFI